MKTSHFLFVLLLLPIGVVSAQSHKKIASNHKVQKKPVVTERLEELRVGDTCYVTSKALHLRGIPSASGKPHIAFEHGKDLIVQEIENDKWILIVSYDLDVGVIGYVARRYVSKTKPK